MEIKDVRLYNRAVEKVLKKEALKIIGEELPKKTEELKEIQDKYREALKIAGERIKNGELDKEIQKQMYLIQLDDKLKEGKSGEER